MSMEGYGNPPGYPVPTGSRQSSRIFMDPAPLPPYAATNGMLSSVSRPGPGGNPVPASLSQSREDNLSLSMSNGGSRTQQASHEVFMVREASRPSGLSSSTLPPQTQSSSMERSPFTSSGNRFQEESSSVGGVGMGGGGGHHNSRSSSEREKDRDRDRDRGSFTHPKMLKIAVIGDSTSGKTAICNAFTSEGYSFSRNYHMTTGVSIYAKSIKLPSNKSGASGTGGSLAPSSTSSSSEDSASPLEPRINLVLVDSGGKPIYREMLPQYWDRLDGVALVIDLTSSTALEKASDWLSLAKGCIGDNQTQAKHIPSSDGSGDRATKGGSSQDPNSPFLCGVLIGSKSDLKDQRVISPKVAQDFAARHGLQYFECSAKENGGIEEPFFFLAHQWTTKGLQDKENMEDSSGHGPSSMSVTGGARIAGSSRNTVPSSSSSSQKPPHIQNQSRQHSSEAF